MIDLICVEEPDGKTLSCGIADEEGCEDQLLGPVPYVNGVSRLSEMLRAALPGRFAELRDAQNFLAVVHMRNALLHQNAAGMSYPFRVGR